MDDRGYWSNLLNRRISRRRSLATSGSIVLGTAFLAACGGDEAGGDRDKSGLITHPVDTTKQAKRGGIMKDRNFTDAPSLSVTTGFGNFSNPIGGKVYSTLLRTDPGYLKPATSEVQGHLVESFEWAQDGSQVVMKLRQGVKYHNKPPVNGRALDIDDVLLTWDRFSRLNTARSEVVNALNPDAPVLSLTATDSRTLVLKLKEPVIYVLNYFSRPNPSGGLYIAPKERDSTFDDRADMIGTGPFMLTNYTPSVGFTFKRNPEFWDKDEALVEQIDLPIITEYAAALAQFKAGNIYSMGNNNSPQVNQDEVLSVKREEPRLLIYQGELRTTTPSGSVAPTLIFGWLPENRSPFFDERVRQAFSMSWDRDLYLETFANISRFEAEGLPVESRWHTHVPATEEGLWLDPRDKDFGPNAKFFRHDLAEAKKLLAAAGYPQGFETTSTYVAGPEYPTSNHAAVIDGFLRELGVVGKVNTPDYTKEYIPQYRNGKGQFSGWAYTSSSGGGAGEAISSLANQYWSKGGTAAYRGFSANGKNDQSGDPQLDTLLEKARLERDTEKRRALIFDFQRYLARAMYAIDPPGAATGFTMAWPCIGNFGVYQGSGSYYYGHRLWVDETKPPFKSS